MVREVPAPEETFEVRLHSSSVRGRMTVTVDVIGEVDLGTADSLARTLREEIGQGTGALVVDLSGVDFIALAGLDALATVWTEARSAGAEMTLSRCSRPVLRMLALVSRIGAPLLLPPTIEPAGTGPSFGEDEVGSAPAVRPESAPPVDH